MKANFLDFRKHTKDIVKALELNETVTVLYRGKEKGILYPSNSPRTAGKTSAFHPAFGMWKDRMYMKDVSKYVRRLRESRHDL